jgi:hypothetical protein
MQLIYTKAAPNIEVGHLYEHIFCDFITEQARAKHLFSYVDYHLDARSYYEGYIYIKIETYTSPAVSFFKNLNKLRPQFNNNTINGALLQIMAENRVDIAALDESEVLKTLNAYQITPWKEQASSEKLVQSDREYHPILYKPANMDAFGIIQQSITLQINEDDAIKKSHLLVLFLVVSKAIRSNLQEDITRSSFCFTYEDSFEYDEVTGKVKDINLYRIDKRQSTEITDEGEVAEKLLTTIKQHGFSSRLSESIQQSEEGSDEYPSEAEIVSKLGLSITPDELKNIFNTYNINRVLNNIEVNFTYH